MVKKDIFKKNYDWTKTAIKFGKAAVYVIIAGLASIYSESAWFLTLAPALHALENIVKNYK